MYRNSNFCKETLISICFAHENIEILPSKIFALFYDPTRDSIANNFVIDVYCRCLQILYQIAFFYKI